MSGARGLALLGVVALCAALGPAGPAAGTPGPAGPAGGALAPDSRPAPAGGGGWAPMLQDGSPRQAGFLPEHLDRAVAEAAAGLAPQPTTGRPLYPGAVVLAARHGVVATTVAMGHALRYADAAPTELPADQQLPMRTDTIFDLASLSKLFTSIAAVQQVERGRLDLDATVASYLPAFAANGKQAVTVRQLLTHTSGLPSWLPLWQLPDDAARLAATYGVVPRAAPGTAYLYSDLNLITLGEIVELVAGAPLDAVVRTGIVEPLGLTDTGHNPAASLRPRIAATEFQPGRGLVHGSVHDENAWSFGGVAGHAGVFSTARDLAVLCQTILNGGAYGRARILSRDATELLLTDLNTAFPGHAHGLGFELYQFSYMGAMASPYTAGHTGFTGTTLTIDRTTGSFLLLLTNRVHPSRDWGSIQPRRRAVADQVARAVPVRPVRGRTAWFAGLGHARTATLTLPVPAGGTRLDFALWYDTEPVADTVTLESSADDGSTWTAVPFRLGRSAVDTGTVAGWGGRRWQAATAELPATPGLLVRWRYSTDADLQGRGAYVDAVRVRSGHRVLFDDGRPADAARLRLDGFTASAD